MKRIIVVVLALLWAVCAVAQTDPKDLAKALEPELMGNVFMLRGFPSEKDLKFDSQCNPIGTVHQGSWTLGEMQVEKIEAKGDEVILTGRRSGFAWDATTGQMRKVRLEKGKGKDGDIKVRITIAGPFSDQPAEFVKRVKVSIFIVDFQEMQNLTPSYWHNYLTGTTNKKTSETDASKTKPASDLDLAAKTANGEPIYRVGKGHVSAPKPVYSPDPSYTEAARAARFQGVSVLSAVVLSTGQIADVQIVRPLGLGLDDQAVAVVKTWRFEPAKRDNEPAAVAINIEVSFKLY